MSEYNTQSTTYTAGYVTAYGAAKRGGYTGTYEEFCAAIAGMAVTVEDLENFSVVINTLSPGSSATASYANGVLTLGVPQGAKGDKGDKGDTGEVSQAELDEAIGEIKNDLNQFPNGTYPNMSVGNADQLTATVGIEDNAPYLFRTSGGSVDIGDREDVRKIVGGTIAWNQLVGASSGSLAENGITITFDSTTGETTVVVGASVTGYAQYVFNPADTVQAGHKILLLSDKPLENGLEYYSGRVRGGIRGAYPAPRNKEHIIEAVSSSANNIMLFVAQTATAGTYKYKLLYTDLTLAFGTAIADYAYSLQQATAGAGVEWLKKHFPAQFDSGYQAYDAGSLQSVSGLTAHKMTGFNAYDNTTGKANVVGGNVYQITGTYTGLSLDGEAVTPDASGYFTPAISGELTVTGGNSTNTCVHLVWDGERDGEYEPYVEYTYPLDDSLTLRGIPKVDASGNLYYDGDEYLPDGTVNRRYGAVDLGTLNWSYNPAYGFYCGIPSYIKLTPNSDIANARCAKYAATTAGNVTSGNANKSFAIGTAYVYVSDDAYTDATAFKTAMSGVYLVYELATPTTETADPYQETQIVDDFGTEEFILTDGAFPVPVGHNTMYQNNLRAKLEMAPDSPDGDGLYVVQQENGQNEYVPLASTSTIQDILTRLTALENENA